MARLTENRTVIVTWMPPPGTSPTGYFIMVPTAKVDVNYVINTIIHVVLPIGVHTFMVSAIYKNYISPTAWTMVTVRGECGM